MAQAGGTRAVDNDVSAVTPGPKFGRIKSSLIDLEAEIADKGEAGLCL